MVICGAKDKRGEKKTKTKKVLEKKNVQQDGQRGGYRVSAFALIVGRWAVCGGEVREEGKGENKATDEKELFAKDM